MKAPRFLLLGIGVFVFAGRTFSYADESEASASKAGDLATTAPPAVTAPAGGAAGAQLTSEPSPALNLDSQAQPSKSIEALQKLLSATKNDPQAMAKKDDPASRSAIIELAAAQQMAASLLEQLKSSPGSEANGTLESAESEKAKLIVLTQTTQMLQRALASLKSPPPAVKEVTSESKNDAAAAATDQSTVTTAQEIAQAQAMAEAALATPPLSSASIPASATTARKASAHHGMGEITRPDLGPDPNDPNHHSMDSLF